MIHSSCSPLTGAARKVRKEIADGLFVVHYQPQVDMTTGKITGLEALVRKKDGEGGLRMPKRFIHFYEAHGMLPYVDIFFCSEDTARLTFKKTGNRSSPSCTTARLTPSGVSSGYSE